MATHGSPFKPPTLRPDLPIYPGTLQLLRVTAATIPGPSGGASSGPGVGLTPPTVLYVASTQQLRTDTLAPRDREPCLVVDIAGVTLTAGYYLGHLAGSYQSLPVYEVVGSTAGTTTTSSDMPGLTPEQLAAFYASLTPAQIAALDNLNSCQLQVLGQLPITNIQTITSTLNRTEISNLVDGLTYTQLFQIVTQLPPSQVTVITSSYPLLYQTIGQALSITQALYLLTSLSSQQLSVLVNLVPCQLSTISGLTTTDLLVLTSLTSCQVVTIVGQLTVVQLTSLLSTLTADQLRLLSNILTSSQIEDLISTLTAAQIAALVSGLTPTQLQTLATYPPATIDMLVNTMSISNLAVYLDAGISSAQTVAVGGTITELPSHVQCYKITVSYTDFAVAAATNTINLVTVPAGAVHHKSKIKHSTKFIGGLINQYTVSCGVVGSLSYFISAFNVFQNTGSLVYGTMIIDSTTIATTQQLNHTSTTQITATAGSAGANLNAATQGSLDIFLWLSSGK